jgi:integrase
VCEAWLAAAGAEPPTVLNRNGQVYKPSVLRGYRYYLAEHVLPDLGAARASEVRRADLQALVDRLVGQGIAGLSVRNALNPLRAVYRHLLEREVVAVNPTVGLRLPNGARARERAASAAEAAALLAALPAGVREVYAAAFYAGLRRGELRGLRWDDVDLAAGLIRVRRSWDDYAGPVEPKSEKGARAVPIVALLRDELDALKARTGREGLDFVFGPKPRSPFTPSAVRRGAAKAWADENARRLEEHREAARSGTPSLLVPIGLHECRHTFVSLMHDAGIPLETIGDFVGHSSTYMTDRYRHLLVGAERSAAELFDAYLARADTAGRLAQLDEGEEA